MIELQQFLDAHPALVWSLGVFALTSSLWYWTWSDERKARMRERLDHINERAELIEELIRLKERENQNV